MALRVSAFLLSMAAAVSALADESDWHTSSDATLYTYASRMKLRDDSVLNPYNQIARLPQASEVAELRAGFKVENETVRVTGRFIGSTRESRNAFGTQQRNEAWLSQWQLRLRASEAWSMSAGREVLNWGPAQFRSPSSPFYFDNGRSDPMRELSGVDALKISWTPDMEDTLMLAYVTGSGHVARDAWRDSWLLKADRRGGDWAGGLALAHTPGQGAFLGAHGQFAAGDALLLYAEAASSTRADALLSPADAALPFGSAAKSPRRSDALAGAAWTFDDGQSVSVEYLHSGHGYRAEEESAYFARAAATPLQAGQALGFAPPLLGRDYLHLVWQSNLMESGGYWRMMATHGFTDRGNELSGYGETVLAGDVSIFALAVLPLGSARQEFSSLFRRSLTAGLKIALP